MLKTMEKRNVATTNYMIIEVKETTTNNKIEE